MRAWLSGFGIGRVGIVKAAPSAKEHEAHEPASQKQREEGTADQCDPAVQAQIHAKLLGTLPCAPKRPGQDQPQKGGQGQGREAGFGLYPQKLGSFTASPAARWRQAPLSSRYQSPTSTLVRNSMQAVAPPTSETEAARLAARSV